MDFFSFVIFLEEKFARIKIEKANVQDQNCKDRESKCARSKLQREFCNFQNQRQLSAFSAIRGSIQSVSRGMFADMSRDKHCSQGEKGARLVSFNRSGESDRPVCSFINMVFN